MGFTLEKGIRSSLSAWYVFVGAYREGYFFWVVVSVAVGEGVGQADLHGV